MIKSHFIFLKEQKEKSNFAAEHCLCSTPNLGVITFFIRQLLRQLVPLEAMSGPGRL